MLILGFKVLDFSNFVLNSPNIGSKSWIFQVLSRIVLTLGFKVLNLPSFVLNLVLTLGLSLNFFKLYHDSPDIRSQSLEFSSSILNLVLTLSLKVLNFHVVLNSPNIGFKILNFQILPSIILKLGFKSWKFAIYFPELHKWLKFLNVHWTYILKEICESYSTQDNFP